MGNPITVSVIVVSYNTRELTIEALRSVERTCELPYELLVVDNASSDGTAAAIRQELPNATLFEQQENLGFGRANNVAMEKARGRYLLLLNSDARLISDGDVTRLIDRLERMPGVGVIGPKLVGEEGTLQSSARRFLGLANEIVRRFQIHHFMPRRIAATLLLGPYWAHDSVYEADWIVGACMLVPRQVYERVGGFDPEFFMYGEEQEWCWRIRRAGFRIVFDPGVTVVHRGSASSGSRHEWRVLSALQGDLRFARSSRGRLFAVAFGLVRLAGLTFEALAFGLAARASASVYFSERAQEARTFLRVHWKILRGAS